ncbi:hypothetical protein H2203_005543 [Taxawa tesnikishii (nom. ined.)]|nr:hypothetical protein H2203_005543 [Dothideales sp. JES 119]
MHGNIKSFGGLDHGKNIGNFTQTPRTIDTATSTGLAVIISSTEIARMAVNHVAAVFKLQDSVKQQRKPLDTVRPSGEQGIRETSEAQDTAIERKPSTEPIIDDQTGITSTNGAREGFLDF